MADGPMNCVDQPSIVGFCRGVPPWGDICHQINIHQQDQQHTRFVITKQNILVATLYAFNAA